MIIIKDQEKQMKKNTYPGGILLLVLAVVILATVLVQHFWEREAPKMPNLFRKRKQEEEEPLGKTIEEPWMPKHEIQTYENRSEDNRTSALRI